MGIRLDAQDLLVYMYKGYTEKSRVPSREETVQESKWEIPRIKRAIDYLLDKNLIKATLIAGGLPIMRGITAYGIDVIENPKEFKKNFGHEVNLGIYKFSWGAEEK